MPTNRTTSRFDATLHRPARQDEDCSWTFLLLPKDVSDTLPRRGRVTVEGTINGHSFQATLEPDGELSHWLKVSEEMQEAAKATVGDPVTVELSSVGIEPDPDVPDDFKEALIAAPDARKVWDSTTTVARLDWIHWIVTAKQSKTREKRIQDACDMLAHGKKRVCCFDPSGFYSKAFKAPKPA
ncbi:MAG: hypothetical protein RLZZ505_2109 [Verrucomicrobiota bacterium]|jgi:hypothetical protein